MKRCQVGIEIAISEDKLLHEIKLLEISLSAVSENIELTPPLSDWIEYLGQIFCPDKKKKKKKKYFC